MGCNAPDASARAAIAAVCGQGPYRPAVASSTASSRPIGRRSGFLVCTAIVAVSLVVAYLLDLTPNRRQLQDAIDTARYAVAPLVAATPVPTWERVYLIMLENRDWDEMFRSPEAPYLDALSRDGAVAIQMWDVADASQPNYLALTSGEPHGITDNETYDIDAPSIFDQLEAAGRTWRVHAEELPSACFAGPRAGPGADGPGTYTRAHNPAISFDRIRRDPARCSNVQGLDAFDPLAADFTMIVPDSCHNTHDCSVSVGDAWLSTIVPRIVDAPGFDANGLLIITFDGGSDLGPDDQHRIATTLVGAGVRPGFVSQRRYDHYDVLRTIQTGLGLPCLARSCTTDTMAEMFELDSAGSTLGS